jgi:hypothetical protein
MEDFMIRSIFIGTDYQRTLLGVRQMRFYLYAVLFVAGNIILPWACHIIPDGGRILLPIFFFTLIAGYRYGFAAGLAVGILSPLANYLITGMPVAAFLPIVLVKGSLLAAAASIVAQRSSRLSFLLVLIVIVGYQMVGALFQCIYTGSLTSAIGDLRMAIPGMVIQVVAGYLILRALSHADKTDC